MIEKVAFTSNTGISTDIKPQNISDKKQKEKADKGQEYILWGSLAALAGLGVYMLLRKNPKAVKETAEEAASQTKTALDKAKGKNWDIPSVSKKKRIKNTSVNRNPKPVSNEREAQIIQNLNTQNVDAKSRSLVENSSQNIVTPEHQTAYDRSISYQPLNTQQKNKLAELQMKNKAERELKNSVEANLDGITRKGRKIEFSPSQKEQEIASLEGSIKNLERRIAGAKRFGKNTNELEKQLAALIDKKNSVTAA